MKSAFAIEQWKHCVNNSYEGRLSQFNGIFMKLMNKAFQTKLSSKHFLCKN